MSRTSENPIEQRVEGAQTQIIVRLLVGVLRESWGLIVKRLLGSKIGKEYIPKLDRQATESLQRLKKSFGSSSMMANVRNDYAFHYPSHDDMEDAFQRALASSAFEELDWGVYFSRTLLNCFFFVSDYVFAHGLSSAAGEVDVVEGHKKLLGALGPVAQDLSEVAFGFTAVALKKYVDPVSFGMTVVAKIDNAPSIDNLVLPFYVEIPGQDNRIV